MKIISLEKTKDRFNGYIEDQKNYIGFSWNKKEGYEEYHKYKKKDYKNYDHYVGVMSKFNPYTFFLIKPIETKKLNYEILEKAYKQLKES